MSTGQIDSDTSLFNASSVDLDTANPVDIICYLSLGKNDYNGMLGARISAIFVIGCISSAVTFFPVLAKRSKRLRIPTSIYLFARYFGAGVIVATAFIHLLDPAYGEIGPNTCVGMTGNWASYSWCPAIVLTSVMVIFLMDFGAERYVEMKYGSTFDANVEDLILSDAANREKIEPMSHPTVMPGIEHEHGTRRKSVMDQAAQAMAYQKKFAEDVDSDVEETSADREAKELAFKQQIAAFLILEFGVVFHSVIIGLNLGVVGDEFKTLYPVLVFHQSFEGLGIGARMSSIPFRRGSVLPWILCAAYGLTTPIAIAIGLGVRTTYNPGSFTANVVSGVLDSISAGILIYTGLVELLARDFLFNPDRTRDNKKLIYMIFCVLLGAGIMALLGKWA